MKKAFFLSLIFVSLLFCTPVYAIDITQFTSPSGMAFKDINTVLVVHDGNNMSEMYLDGGLSSSLRLINVAGLQDVAVDSEGRLIMSVWVGSGTGFIYRIAYPTGIADFSEYTSSQITTLGSFGSGTGEIEIDADDNIYVASGNTLYSLSYPSYSSSTLHTFSDNQLKGLALHPDGIVLGNYDSVTTEKGYHRVYLYYPNNDTVLNIPTLDGETGTDYSVSRVDAVGATVNGDIYAAWKTVNTNLVLSDGTSGNAAAIAWADYSNSWYSSRIGIVSYVPSDMLIDSEGTIYVSYPDGDNILMYATDGLYGGYFFAPSSDSSSSSSSNTTSLTGDSHEWTNDEIATSSRQIVPPIFFLVLIIFFMYAIGGN